MRFLGVLIVVALTSLACSGYTVPNTPVTADMGVVLEGSALEPQCSRDDPGEVEAT